MQFMLTRRLESQVVNAEHFVINWDADHFYVQEMKCMHFIKLLTFSSTRRNSSKHLQHSQKHFEAFAADDFENIVAKCEFTHYKQILILPNCFQHYSIILTSNMF